MFIWVKLGILFLYVAIVYTNCHRTLLLGLRAEKGRCSVTQFRLQAFVCVRAVLLATVEYSTGQCTCPSRVHIKEAVCLVAPCPSVVLCYSIVIFPRSYYVLHHRIIPWVNDIRHMSYSISRSLDTRKNSNFTTVRRLICMFQHVWLQQTCLWCLIRTNVTSIWTFTGMR